VLDVIGVFDPTGLADLLNAAIYLAEGDYANASLSLIAIVPYLGDVAKFAKWTKRAAAAERALDLTGDANRAFDIAQQGGKNLPPRGNILGDLQINAQGGGGKNLFPNHGGELFKNPPAAGKNPDFGAVPPKPKDTLGAPPVHNPKDVAPVARGVPENANFAQRTFRQAFSTEEGALFPGRTVAEVAADLRSGVLTPADVPIQFIVRDGNTLILNTRSAQALTQAGIPRSQWNAANMTGNAAAEARLTGQLQRNNLTSQGTPTVRPSGGN
jgi:hypothetical protein